MKKLMKKILFMVFIFGLFFASLHPETVQAASKNKKAGNAFAKAVANGKIRYGKHDKFSLCDVNNDGVKELIIESDYSFYTAWQYKKGKVTRLFDFEAEYTLSYDKKKKVFWMRGEADCAWAIAYKLKGKKLVEKKESYLADPNMSPEKVIYQKTVNGKTKGITAKKYNQAMKRIEKNNAMKMKTVSKTKLIQTLTKMK